MSPAARSATTHSSSKGRDEVEHLMKARSLIWDAIGEINQSKTAIHLTRQLSELYNIEDVLWQFATAMKGE